MSACHWIKQKGLIYYFPWHIKPIIYIHDLICPVRINENEFIVCYKIPIDTHFKLCKFNAKENDWDSTQNNNEMNEKDYADVEIGGYNSKNQMLYLLTSYGTLYTLKMTKNSFQITDSHNTKLVSDNVVKIGTLEMIQCKPHCLWQNWDGLRIFKMNGMNDYKGMNYVCLVYIYIYIIFGL